MSANRWVEHFRQLHTRARKNQLDASEQREYQAAREYFARALTAAQGLSVPENQSARRMFRVAQGLQVDLTFQTGPLRAMTLDVSVGGFSVLMHKPPPEDEQPEFSLRLPGIQEPIVARARQVSVQRKIATHRVSFSIEGLETKDAERLETALFDLALERIK